MMKVYYYVFIVLLCVNTFVVCDDSYWCDGGDKEQQLFNSLNGLYLNTEPTSWAYSHLWGSSECPCTWFGVDCVSDGNSTVRLNLDNNEIYGSLTDGFCADLYSLVNLSNNRFFSTVVSCIGDMTSLSSLKLANNTFQGILPESLGNLSELKTLDIKDNNFAGPYPDYLECPKSYFKSSVDVKLKDNDFWCPCPEWISEDDCDCVDEPSDSCTSLNAAACEEDLACCYSESWNEECDDFISKNESDIVCEEYPRVTCEEDDDTSSDNSNLFWYIFFGAAGVLIVFVIGWSIVCAITFS